MRTTSAAIGAANQRTYGNTLSAAGVPSSGTRIRRDENGSVVLRSELGGEVRVVAITMRRDPSHDVCNAAYAL